MIRNKIRQKYQVIDLTGPQGNAHYLMGYAKGLSKQLGLNSDSILKDMKSMIRIHMQLMMIWKLTNILST